MNDDITRRLDELEASEELRRDAAEPEIDTERIDEACRAIMCNLDGEDHDHIDEAADRLADEMDDDADLSPRELAVLDAVTGGPT